MELKEASRTKGQDTIGHMIQRCGRCELVVGALIPGRSLRASPAPLWDANHKKCVDSVHWFRVLAPCVVSRTP
eukprot:10294598-Karenia_brevis.AAC.1